MTNHRKSYSAYKMLGKKIFYNNCSSFVNKTAQSLKWYANHQFTFQLVTLIPAGPRVIICMSHSFVIIFYYMLASWVYIECRENCMQLKLIIWPSTRYHRVRSRPTVLLWAYLQLKMKCLKLSFFRGFLHLPCSNSTIGLPEA